MSRSREIELENKLVSAEEKGDLSEVKRILTLLSLGAGQFADDISEILKISLETIRQAIHKFFSFGVCGLKSKFRPGRPPKLTKTHRKKLYEYIVKGPEKIRKRWLKDKWPEILSLANKKDAHIFFGMNHRFHNGVV